ncbi:MAG: DUF7577 domain-containing protein [Candidatus Limnocylindria bacterium]
MTNDERERRDWPDESDEAPEQAHPEPTAGAESEPGASLDTGGGWPAADDAGAASPDLELETQPAADDARPTEPVSPPWPTEPPLAESAGPGTWPTTAPDRAEATEGGWPTAAPEHVDEPWAAAPPPSEVEAYDAVPPEPTADASMAHSVPATAAATAESTQCPRCGTENPAGLAFCRNCGQRLIAAGVAPALERPGVPEGTMACPRCGTHNRAGVAFCQNCGANLRTAAMGYVPPAVAPAPGATGAASARARAVLGPVVLLIGVVGLVTAYLLPFATGSLFERAAGTGGYGVAFWTGYADVAGGLVEQAYYGFAAPAPILMLLLMLLAIGGLVRAVPGPLQIVGLAISLLWSVGLAVLFAVVEVAGNWQGDLVGLLRVLTPAGIIFFLAALIVLIGTLTRFGRS